MPDQNWQIRQNPRVALRIFRSRPNVLGSLSNLRPWYLPEMPRAQPAQPLRPPVSQPIFAWFLRELSRPASPRRQRKPLRLHHRPAAVKAPCPTRSLR